ncbi:MAG: hypothetical protein AAGF75_02095 [Cyanobacteria bacterium P01_H01_bin.130]
MTDALQQTAGGVSAYNEETPPNPMDELVQRHTNTDPGDLLYHLAIGELSGILACKSGAGKTTSLHYCLVQFLNTYPHGTAAIADPKGSRWLGLENCPDVVTQLISACPKYPKSAMKLDEDTLLVASELLALSNVVDRAWNEYRNRVKARAQAARAGQPQPTFEPDLTVIDEWFGLWDKLNNFSASTQEKLGVHTLGVKINDIISRGRELGVRLLLVSQSHLCGQIGISGALRESLVVVAQGRKSTGEGGGFGSVHRLIKDANVFADDLTREALGVSLRFALATIRNTPDLAGTPVLASTQGIGFVGLAGDLQWASEQELGVAYLQNHPHLRSPKHHTTIQTPEITTALTPQAQAIDDWIGDKEGIFTPREIYRATLPELEGFDTEQILKILEELKEAGLGELFKEKQWWRYRPK